MKVPIPGKAAVIALAISGAALSGCATDGYGGYGSVSVGSGWYGDYYPGYYGYDYGYGGYPGYYYRPGSRYHRQWNGRPPTGNWQGRPQRPDGHDWRGGQSSSDGRWRNRSEATPQSRPDGAQAAQPSREGRWQGQGGTNATPNWPQRGGRFTRPDRQ